MQYIHFSCVQDTRKYCA